MNRYSLSSDSDHWWYPTAVAGTICAAAVGAILVAPVVGAQATSSEAPSDSAVPADTGAVVLIERPCYMARPGWNTPAGWEQPVCTTAIRRGTEPSAVPALLAPGGYGP